MLTRNYGLQQTWYKLFSFPDPKAGRNPSLYTPFSFMLPLVPPLLMSLLTLAKSSVDSSTCRPVLHRGNCFLNVGFWGPPRTHQRLTLSVGHPQKLPRNQQFPAHNPSVMGASERNSEPNSWKTLSSRNLQKVRIVCQKGEGLAGEPCATSFCPLASLALVQQFAEAKQLQKEIKGTGVSVDVIGHILLDRLLTFEADSSGGRQIGKTLPCSSDIISLLFPPVCEALVLWLLLNFFSVALSFFIWTIQSH